ncbi:Flp family type IVb pilin [Sphingobium phenoxybenzoativorans]|uniref:Flp family type IVb pilin n=1 Tax=Sphingobium phenoxybenzoativorans TaxID=1592790 RepID=A0A975K5E1_9SPHN|nr:Flp family type IVb pilin [Sphingobium phenoxybenzoativorans]QUT05123.1 Flp family type IVb pilin [Sphingobium phenoxybenzoativorans]
MRRLLKLASANKGATAIEYGLIAALIAIAAITAMSQLGTKLKNTYSKVANNM